jgi:glutathione S-transferase
MITLHQFRRVFGLPNASPFCMKVETYLRLAKLDYELANVDNPGKAPKKLAPFIVDGNRTIADSALILQYLQKTYGDPLSDGLDDRTRAHHHAIAVMCEEHLYFALVFERWLRPENCHHVREAFFNAIPGAFRPLMFKLVQRSLRRRLHQQGMGRHSQAEREDLAIEDIRSLADILGDDSFFGGERARQVDCVTLGFLANIIRGPGAGRIKDAAAGHKNLVSYTDRLLKDVFPDIADSAKA